MFTAIEIGFKCWKMHGDPLTINMISAPCVSESSDHGPSVRSGCPSLGVGCAF